MRNLNLIRLNNFVSARGAYYSEYGTYSGDLMWLLSVTHALVLHYRLADESYAVWHFSLKLLKQYNINAITMDFFHNKWLRKLTLIRQSLLSVTPVMHALWWQLPLDHHCMSFLRCMNTLLFITCIYVSNGKLLQIK